MTPENVELLIMYGFWAVIAYMLINAIVDWLALEYDEKTPDMIYYDEEIQAIYNRLLKLEADLFEIKASIQDDGK